METGSSPLSRVSLILAGIKVRGFVSKTYFVAVLWQVYNVPEDVGEIRKLAPRG